MDRRSPRIIAPTGKLRVDPSKRPRGLLRCHVCNNPIFNDLAKDAPVSQGGTVKAVAGATAFGLGMLPPTGAATRFVQAPLDNQFGAGSAKCSMEVLLYFNLLSASQGGLCGIGEGTITSGTSDRMLYFDGSEHVVFLIFDGANKTVTSTTALVTGKLYHAVGVADGSNIRLYINGLQEATLAVANGGFAGYTTPFFGVGGASTAHAANVSDVNSTILLANFATEAWTAAEVMARYREPYSFLLPVYEPVFVTPASGAVYFPFNGAFVLP